MEKLLNYREMAAFLGVPIGTLYSMVSRKQIPHIRLSGRLVRFDEAKIKRWMEARRVTVLEAPDAGRKDFDDNV